jgi:Flp pilus assembly protein TadG
VIFAAWCNRIARRWRTDSTKGSAALEFAFVAPVFFLLLMATLETAIIFFAQSSLQGAVNDIARQIRTGQAACFNKDSNGNCLSGSLATMTQAEFRTAVCNEVSVLLKDCGGPSLQFDVQPFSAGFGSNGSPLDASGNLPALNNFNIGNACEVVLVRAFYKWPVVTPMLDFFLGNVTGGYHLLSTAASFRNEPFNNNVAGC